MSDYKTFRCPNCKQFVNNTMAICKHCSFPLDEQTISNTSATQERINSTYNSASNVRILAGAMWMFFFFSLIPFIGIIGRVGSYIAFIGVPVLLIIWLVRYAGLPKSEPEIADARKYLLTGFGIWLIYPVVYVVLMVLLVFGLTAYELSR